MHDSCVNNVCCKWHWNRTSTPCCLNNFKAVISIKNYKCKHKRGWMRHDLCLNLLLFCFVVFVCCLNLMVHALNAHRWCICCKPFWVIDTFLGDLIRKIWYWVSTDNELSIQSYITKLHSNWIVFFYSILISISFFCNDLPQIIYNKQKMRV